MTRVIAITGGTGFVGRATCAELLAAGHKVKALVRKPSTAGLDSAIDIIEGNLSDERAIDRLLEGTGCIVHLAGATAAPGIKEFFRVNAHGTVALAEAAVRHGTRRFVHVSSLAARKPELSGYCASKRAGEDAIAKLMGTLNAVIVRPPAVYGPGDRGTLPLIRELTHALAFIPACKDQRFSLIDVNDLARCLAAAAVGDMQGLHEVSDGKSGGYSWPELQEIASTERGGPVRLMFLPRAVALSVASAAESWAKLTGKPSMVNRGKIRELYHSDWVSHEGTLAIQDPVRFDAGFARTVAWYRKAGWLPRPRHVDRTATDL